MAFKIFRKIQELLDVNLTSPADGEVLSYDAASSKWINSASAGGGGAPTNATYITQTSNPSLSAEQALGSLATGVLKNTTTTGVLSIATEGTDYYKPGGTDVAVADGGTGASTAAGARTNLGLVIDTDVPSETAFADHSARHENGGADQISIAGLAGISTELQNHLSDATDAHDASAVSIVDSGAYFTGADVEAALQELGASGGGSSLLTAITDPFTYADGTLPFPPWVPMFQTGGSQPSISTNKVLGASGKTLGMVHTNEMYPSDNYAEIQVTSDALASGDWIGPVVRSRQESAATLGFHCYLGIYFNNGGTYQLIMYRRSDETTFTQIGSTYNLGGALSAGDKLRLTATGSSLAFSVNGTDRVTATDTNYLDGYPGFMVTGAAYLDGFETSGVKALNHGYRHYASHPEELTDYYKVGGTDVAVADGGTGSSTAAGAATNLGLGTGDSPQFTAVNIGNASDTTVSRVSAGDIAVEGNTVYRAAGTDVALADGGTGASLSDPNADRIMFWDDSAGGVTWLTPGTGLTITATTIDASGGSSLGNYREVWDSGIGNKELPGTYTVVQGTWSWFSDGSQPVDSYYINNGTSTAQNDEITIPVVLAAGTWRIDCYVVKNNNCGIITASIDGSSVGTMDTYAGTVTYGVLLSITGITVATTGVKTLSLKMATKNASSTNYRLNLTKLALTRTGS